MEDMKVGWQMDIRGRHKGGVAAAICREEVGSQELGSGIPESSWG